MKNANKKFYSLYRIILKENNEGVKEENIKDLKILSTFNSLKDVADYLNYNNSYISSLKNNDRYIIIDNKYIIYTDYED